MIALLIVVAAVAYAVSIIAFGRGPGALNSNLFGAVVNFLGTLVPLALFLTLRTHDKSLGTATHKGFAYALLGGVAIGVFTLALAKVFSTGQNVSFVTPLVYGGAVLLSSLAGIVLFREKVQGFATVGMILIALGIMSIAYATYAKGATK